MKNKLIITLIFILVLFGTVGCDSEKDKTDSDSKTGEKQNLKNLNFGDEISVQLNDKVVKNGHVIKDNGNTVEVLLEDIDTGLKYKDLEYHMEAKKDEWTNVKDLHLLDVDVCFKHFEVESTHTMDGYVISYSEEKAFLSSPIAYWLANSDTERDEKNKRDHGAYCHSGDGDIDNCNWMIATYEIEFADKSYYELGFRPVVEVEKKYLIEIDHSNSEYKLFDSVKLKDGSSWVVLEDLGSEVLIVESKKSALTENYNIKKKLNEHISKLEKRLNENNVDTSKMESRIPTTSDMKKYFDVDFNSKENYVNGRSLSSTEQSLIKDWEYSSFWVKNDSVTGLDEYIACKSTQGKIHCYIGDDESDEKWHTLAVIKISKKALIK